MENNELFPLKNYRQVTELRIQYQCEYRLYLKNRYGDQPSSWSKRGSMLHEMAANTHPRMSNHSFYAKIILFVLTVIAGILWILG